MTHILLVEDESLLAILTCISLEDSGFEVTVARDGQEGFDIATKTAPDIVITDVQMPIMTGLELITQLRAGGFSAPIIIATAIQQEMLPARGGYNAYIAKPYSQEHLIDTISRLFQPIGYAEPVRDGS